MKRRSLPKGRSRRTNSYARKLRLKLNGRSRRPGWMWWTENERGGGK